MDLNDDCLLVIINHLSINDLLNVGNVGQRLKSLTMLSFKTQHKSTLNLIAVSARHRGTVPDRSDQIIEAFGRVATKMTYYLRFQTSAQKGVQVLIHIAKHCKSLVSLELRNFSLDLTGRNEKTMAHIWRLMSNITELSLISSSLSENILRFCQGVESLRLCYFSAIPERTNNNTLNQHFPHLKSLDISDMPNAVIDGLLEAYRNNIRCLKLNTTIFSDEPYHILTKAGHLPQLTDLFLTLHIGETSETRLNDIISEVTAFPTLKELKLELKLGKSIATKSLFEKMSSVVALQDIKINGVWEWGDDISGSSIKLRRSDDIHELYHGFAPY